MSVFRCYTEKREEFDTGAKALLCELRDFLGIRRLESLRILNRYDVEGISKAVYQAAILTIFSQPQTDYIYDETPPDFGNNCRILIVEALPGQYDQRADSCAQCLRVLSEYTDSVYNGQNARLDEERCEAGESAYDLDYPIIVKTAKVYVLYGDMSDGDMKKLRGYLINPVESHEAVYEKAESLADYGSEPNAVETLHGFISADDEKLRNFLNIYELAMDMADLHFCQAYFRDTEARDPTITELRLIDTYWSDHCRHTTFFTHISDVTIDDPKVQAAYDAYLEARNEVYGADIADRPITLMDIATITTKILRKRGMLANMDISEEVNACSIRINANVDGKNESWFLMFKNETHNHPTEVEPFGGAATCVGGAIRDPLSGRAYVYQAMRITGAGNPLAAIEDTLPGKIPQRKLTTTAAQGYSSYGNQIGLAAGLVHEIYHPGYVAKRMELGAVVGAVKAENVRRETPLPGDLVILLGGRTGRDGIGGATGSSKSQTDKSIVAMASEVQKGNAAVERNIQRLFLYPEVTKMIKKCNDFGAGGVSVAVGELADGLDINLSHVRCKYNGLDGTELAISESQERMAVVVSPDDVNAFIKKAGSENLEAYAIAEVTDNARMVMRHDGKVIVDISRKFLSTNGSVKQASVIVKDSGGRGALQHPIPPHHSPVERLKVLVGDLRFCSQRGLYEMFDGSAGASSVLMKSGGKTRSTPVQIMASLLPVGLDPTQLMTTFPISQHDAGLGNSIAPLPATTTCSVMAFGYDPYLSSENPFIGAKIAVITSIAKLVSAGCDPDTVYLSFQEFFERLRDDPVRWGKPFSALLGAFEAQMELGLAAIGGKDSMSGSFNELDVPPTLVSFAIAPNDVSHIISPEFKQSGHDVVIFEAGNTLAATKNIWKNIRALIEDKVIVSAWAITEGGAAEGVFKMALGNEIGYEHTAAQALESLFTYSPGAIVAEVVHPVPDAMLIGRTIPEPIIKIGVDHLSIAELKSVWDGTLEPIFPTKSSCAGNVSSIDYSTRTAITSSEHFAKPRVVIFAFPGSNGELDTARAVSRAGGIPRIINIRNLTPDMFKESIAETKLEMKESQILIISGGFSFGDEPDGSAKFITAFFRNPVITEATHEHLKMRDGLMLGICNGFQAFIKLGLVPFGEIISPGNDSPVLTLNTIGKFQAGYYYTRVASVNSPWMNLCSVGDIHAIAVSHGEGRFIASDDMLNRLIAGGQIATQYTDIAGNPSMETLINPDGSMMAVEGIFSPDGKVFGKMGHTERHNEHVAKNIYGEKYQPIFESGINYFR